MTKGLILLKLNWDCMRDILKVIEAMSYDEKASVKNLCSELAQYSENDVRYSCLKLHEAGMILAVTVDIDNTPRPSVTSIADITYRGHEFLAKLRDDERWNGIKKCLPQIRDYSLEAINAVANGITSGAIAAYLSSTTQ